MHRWIEIPAAGQDPDELEEPAPQLTIIEGGTRADARGRRTGSRPPAIGGAVNRARLSRPRVALLLAALPWRGAHAHAVLLESSPAADAVLAEAPERIVLRFNEPVRPAVVRLLRAADEASVELERRRGRPTRSCACRCRRACRTAAMSLSYRVTSADGHPVVGQLRVRDRRAGRTRAARRGRRPHDNFWAVAGVVARALWYGSLLLAAGLALFLGAAAVSRRSSAAAAARACLARSWLGLAACLAMLGATGGALHGGPPDALLTRRALALRRSARRSRVSVPAAALGPRRPGPRGAAARPPAAARPAGRRVLVAVSFALSGHAATAGPRWITRPALTLHALARPSGSAHSRRCLLALRRAAARPRRMLLLRAFSRRAVVAVACLLLAGVVLAALQLRTPAALIDDRLRPPAAAQARSGRPAARPRRAQSPGPDPGARAARRGARRAAAHDRRGPRARRRRRRC